MDDMERPSNGENMEGRAANGRFTKGWGGGGRKKIPDDVKAMMQAIIPDAVRYLAALINDESARNADRVRAAEILMDRVYGKPQQSVDLDATSIPQVVIVGADELK